MSNAATFHVTHNYDFTEFWITSKAAGTKLYAIYDVAAHLYRSMSWNTACDREECWLAEVWPDVLWEQMHKNHVKYQSHTHKRKTHSQLVTVFPNIHIKTDSWKFHLNSQILQLSQFSFLTWSCHSKSADSIIVVSLVLTGISLSLVSTLGLGQKVCHVTSPMSGLLSATIIFLT